MANHSERILERLHELGWSKTKLAEKAKIQPATLSRLLSSEDVRLKREQTMASIARAMGVRTEWLITGQEPKAPTQTVTTTLMEFLENDGLTRLSVAVEAYAEYIEQGGVQGSTKNHGKRSLQAVHFIYPCTDIRQEHLDKILKK